MLDKHQYLWNELNICLSNMCCDEKISEEEMEFILDECQLLDTEELIDFCLEYYDIKFPEGV